MSSTTIVQTRLNRNGYKKVTDSGQFLITATGKYLQLNPLCPHCGSKAIVRNGYYLVEKQIFLDLDIRIKNGHYLCKTCRRTFSTSYKKAQEVAAKIKRYIQERCFKDYYAGKTFDVIAQDISEQSDLSICKQTASKYYEEIAIEYKDRKVLKTSGIFNIDCQHVSINGKKVYRLTIQDAVTKKNIHELPIPQETLKEIIERVRLMLLPYEVKGLIVDGKIGLKDALEKEFDVPVQLCVMHYQSLVVRDYTRKYGKQLNLEQYRNLYISLDILVNHEVEIELLNRQLKKLDKFRGATDFFKRTEKSIGEYEKQLVSEFLEKRRALKRHRRKYEDYLISRTEQESQAKLEYAKLFLTGEFLKPIRRIENNFESLTHFTRIESMPSTNNGVEHYYSKTLTKTSKKRFRSMDALKTRLTAARAVINDWFEFSVTLKDILRDFIELKLLFGSVG